MRRNISVVAVLGLLTSAAIMATAPVANAKIIVGQGIAGIKPGESEAQVISTLGAPVYTTPADQAGESSWGYPKTLEGRIGFDRSMHVSSMWTLSKRQKTNKGIGPGSSLAQVRKAYPKAKCITGPFGPKSLICILKSKLGGRVVETDFPLPGSLWSVQFL